MLDPDEGVLPFADAQELVELRRTTALPRFCVFWMRSTIRKVIIVVPAGSRFAKLDISHGSAHAGFRRYSR
jgi:hypothetical protein